MHFLEVNNLKLEIGGHDILKGVSFSVDSDERVGIIGPSASGKTSLLKTIAAIFKPSSGEVLFQDGVPSIGFLFQEGGLFDSMTVLENVSFSFHKLSLENKYSKKEVEDISVEMLNKVGLFDARNKYTSELSGGMRKRVGIARALVHGPELLLLDDPTSGLDPVTASVIMDLISDLVVETKCAVLMVSHDLRRLIPRIDRLIMLSDGLLVYDEAVEKLEGMEPGNVRKFIETRYDFA